MSRLLVAVKTKLTGPLPLTSGVASKRPCLLGKGGAEDRGAEGRRVVPEEGRLVPGYVVGAPQVHPFARRAAVAVQPERCLLDALYAFDVEAQVTRLVAPLAWLTRMELDVPWVSLDPLADGRLGDLGAVL